MRKLRRFILTFLPFGVLSLTLPGTPALGDAPITLHIANTGIDSLIVSLYDRNLRRRQQVLSGQVVNGNASISITVSADSRGQGHLFWTAMTVDRAMRLCGHDDKRGVNDGATVHVFANGPCKHR